MSATVERLTIVGLMEKMTAVERADLWEELRKQELAVQDPPLWIYAVRAGDGDIKIGITQNPKARFYGLQSANSEKLVGIAAWRALPEEEKWIHEDFADIRIRGEWFAALPSLITYLRRRGGKFDWR